MSQHAAMPPALEALPAEVFLRITQELSKTDLKTLAQVSNRLRRYPPLVQELWRSVVVRPRYDRYGRDDARRREQRLRPSLQTVADLHEHRLRLEQHLEFRALRPTRSREECQHRAHPDDYYRNWAGNTHADLEESLFRLPLGHAQAVLERLWPGQLDSFSWDMDSCIPPSIFGPDGLVTLHHPSLRSLALSTDLLCTPYPSDALADGLAAFTHLQSLRWISPRPADLPVLRALIRANSPRLRTLELDFVRWRLLRAQTDGPPPPPPLDAPREEHRAWGEQVDLACAEGVFNLSSITPGDAGEQVFAAIRTLSLTEVPLAPAVVGAVNFGALRALALRRCPGWRGFLARVVELGVPLRLKALEVCDFHDDGQSGDGGSGEGWVAALEGVLGAFGGLEALFVAHEGPLAGETGRFWETALRRHGGTLKRFVHHQRVGLGDSGGGRTLDSPRLGVVDAGVVEDPGRNPLAPLELDFLGLCCPPERLKVILLPFTSKRTLKVVHLRQTAHDHQTYGSWAQPPRAFVPRGVEEEEAAEGDDQAEPLPKPVFCSHVALRGLRPRLLRAFRRFAEWAFGPRGVGSLRLVVYGDLASSGRVGLGNILLCRNGDGGGGGGGGGSSNFRAVCGECCRDVLDDYRHELGVCPAELAVD